MNKNFLWSLNKNIFEGFSENDRTGNKVSVSSNGKIVAIGENGAEVVDEYDNKISMSGRIRVVSFENPDEPKGILMIEGKEEYSFVGHTLQVSGNGKKIIVGEPFYNDDIGKVSIYNLETNEYEEIYGTIKKENFGWDVTISKNANRIAICSSFYDAFNIGVTKQGGIKVYDYITSKKSWDLITHISDSVQSCQNVSFSDDGNVLIVVEKGYPVDDVTSVKSNYDHISSEGQVRCFRFDTVENSFKSFGGAPITGINLDSASNYSISISGDGKTFIFGEKGFTINDDIHIGRVRVFKYNSLTELWDQIGNDILGDNVGDCTGCSVDVNFDGTIICIGEHRFPKHLENGKYQIDSGRVRVFELNQKNTIWNQIGQSIEGEFEENDTGASIALSSDGNVLVVGEPTFKEEDTKTCVGRIRIFNRRYLKDGEESVFIQGGNELDFSVILEEKNIKPESVSETHSEPILESVPETLTLKVEKLEKNKNIAFLHKTEGIIELSNEEDNISVEYNKESIPIVKIKNQSLCDSVNCSIKRECIQIPECSFRHFFRRRGWAIFGISIILLSLLIFLAFFVY